MQYSYLRLQSENASQATCYVILYAPQNPPPLPRVDIRRHRLQNETTSLATSTIIPTLYQPKQSHRKS